MHRRFLLVLGMVLAVLACGATLRMAWEDVAQEEPAYAQETGTCPSPQLIDTFQGTGDQQSDTFDTTTDSFRVTYEVDEGNTTDPALAPSLFIDVIDTEGIPVSNASQDGAGTGETFVNEPPGTYYLDISFIGGQGATYNITVEQCEGGSPSRNPGTASPTATTQPTASPTATATPTATAEPEDRILDSGAPRTGPVPLMPGGVCPKEYPLERGGSCYRD